MNEDRAAADDIEFEIKRLPKGGFRATVHIFRGERWWPPDSGRASSGSAVEFIERGVREKDGLGE
jgi:hypothetical protein